MKHALKVPPRLPSGSRRVKVGVELVPVDAAEPSMTLSFTTFSDAWAARLVDEVSVARSAPLLWVGWRDESYDPPKTREVPVAPSVFGLEEISSRLNSNLVSAVRENYRCGRHVTVGTRADTFIVNLSFTDVDTDDLALDSESSVDLVTQKRRIRDEF